MASEKTLAVVIRIVEFSETSCVVTLFSRDFGKITGLAKGARRLKSPFEGAIDLLALCRLVFLHKSTDALDILTEAKLERRFRAGSRDLTRLYAGYYVAELLNDLNDEHDPHPELFDIAEETIRRLDDSGPLPLTLLHFELALLRILGHLPALDQCVGCGRGMPAEAQRVSFGLTVGGVLCGLCRAGRKQVISMSGELARALRRASIQDLQNWDQLQLDGREQGELRGVLNQYMNHLLGRRPRLQDYLKVGV